MKKIRFFIALWAAKISKIILKITKHNATNFPGIVANKICPEFLKYINKPETIIGVTGTNGKTTVSNIIIDLFEKDNQRVLNNSMGSNIVSGISTSLINGANIFGKTKFKKAVFEIDERSAKLIFPYLIPDYLLITNLSRDSIMRNAHPEYIAKILTKYIPKETKLILNADDLISANVSPKNQRFYYGIDKMESDIKECKNLINDLQICPKCSTKLKYEYLRYHHIGKAICPSCGYTSPKSDYLGTNVDLKNMTIKIKDNKETGNHRLLNDSIFNIYNVVSAVSLFRILGYSHEIIEELFKQVKIIKSRYNYEKVKDKTIYMQMAKGRNAYACTRVFDYISQQPGEKEIILMMNNLQDEKKWSENTCWLYDCDYEFLNQKNIKNIIIVGPRYKDYYLRALYAGISKDKVTSTLKEFDSIKLLKLFKNDNIYILYGTGSIELAKNLKEQIKKHIEEEVK